ncbi:MAG: YkgJ family cysteine cluster protein [Candidatus Gastranaerophilaceae bacterium]
MEDQQNTFPQHLCKMCGRCCRAIIPEYSFSELEKLSKEGDDEADVFVNIFKRYDSIESARKVVPEQVEQVLRELTYQNKDLDINSINFYYCPYITEENKCSRHETRPDCCRRAPRHGWSLFPPGCGFEGWQFEKRERIKKSIRSLKEYLYEKEILHGEGPIPNQNMTVAEFRKIVDEKINEWERYGAKYL